MFTQWYVIIQLFNMFNSVELGVGGIVTGVLELWFSNF